MSVENWWPFCPGLNDFGWIVYIFGAHESVLYILPQVNWERSGPTYNEHTELHVRRKYESISCESTSFLPLWLCCMQSHLIWKHFISELDYFLHEYVLIRYASNNMVVRILWHDDVIKWKHFPRYWPFVRGIHRSPVNSPHKGQWRGALIFSLICVWINGWVNNREAGDLRRIMPIMTSV